MSDWLSVRLEELAADERGAISKPYGSAMVKDDYRLSGVPVVRGVNLTNGIFHDENFVFISPELADKMPGAQLTKGDLVVTHRGTVGQVSMIPRSPQYGRYVPSTSQVKVRLDPALAVPEFFYYWFCSPLGRRSILEHVSTVGVPGLVQPVATVKRLLVPKPPLKTQQAVAEVLGALDDKIAANTKLASTADALATKQFHKAVHGLAFSDQSFGDIALVSGGGTPSTKVLEYWDGDIPWATPTDVTPLQGPYLESTNRMISPAGLSACASSLYPAGSILMTSRATIGAFALAQTPMAVNQGFIVVQPADPTLSYWVFHEMRSRVDEFVSLANGATFLELSRGNFKKFKVRLADRSAMEEFGQSAAKLHAVARNGLRENSKLAETRDCLLPQLMSGKLRVKDAEKVLENAGV